MKSKSGRSSRVERGPSARTNPYAAAIESLKIRLSELSGNCPRYIHSIRAAILLLEAAGKATVYKTQSFEGDGEDMYGVNYPQPIFKAIYDAHRGAGK